MATMIRTTQHALEAIETRSISLAWIEATVSSPDRAFVDPARPDRTHSLKMITDFGGRILHVVHRPDGADVVVITAYFDRSAKL
jgi:hypothetical protein